MAHLDETPHLHAGPRSIVAESHGRVEVEHEPVQSGAAVSALAKQGRLMSIPGALRAAQLWNSLVEERADMPEAESDAFGPKHVWPPSLIDREAILDFRTPMRVTVDEEHGHRQFVRATTRHNGPVRMRDDMEVGSANLGR